MNKLTESELIALTGILKLEYVSLALSRAIKPIIDDEDFKKLSESSILEMEGRINAIKKFINTNGITNKEEVM